MIHCCHFQKKTLWLPSTSANSQVHFFILKCWYNLLKIWSRAPQKHAYLKGWVRRVVGTIWNVGAGDPSSLPVRNANSGKPLKVDSLGCNSVKIRCRTWWSTLRGCWQLNSTPVITCYLFILIVSFCILSSLIIKTQKYYKNIIAVCVSNRTRVYISI